jgi:hypothetical protein
MIRVLAPLALSLPLCAALPSSQEALALAFPGAQCARTEHILTDGQAARVQALAKGPLPGRWLVTYEARKEGRLVGVGFFDTHRVRTLNETLLVAVSPEGRILRVETVVFHEPQDYQARPTWVKQFDGKALDDRLTLRGDIHPLSGATLTANAMTDAARRSLALWQVLYGSAK